jgi:hypothetical protein
MTEDVRRQEGHYFDARHLGDCVECDLALSRVVNRIAKDVSRPKGITLTEDDRQKMRNNAHYDPLRQQLRDRATALRVAADRITGYLSSPAQCQEDTATDLWNPPLGQAQDAPSSDQGDAEC